MYCLVSSSVSLALFEGPLGTQDLISGFGFEVGSGLGGFSSFGAGSGVF